MGPREGHDGRMGRGAAFTQSLLVPYYASSQPGCLLLLHVRVCASSASGTWPDSLPPVRSRVLLRCIF